MDQVVELRRYTLHPGRRDELIELFEREFVDSQEVLGIGLPGLFREPEVPDRFTWLRSFPSMGARLAALEAFYGGPVWTAHRDAANATMADSDDVLLLRPVKVSGWARSAALYRATIVDEFGADEVLPELQRFSTTVAVLRSEHAENTFPALPVRADARVDVVISAFASVADHDAAPRVPGSLVLRPTVRSRMR